MKVNRLPFDGSHDMADKKFPEPNTLVCIDCLENVGGAAMFGEDGKWYWTYDEQPDCECSATVLRWCYL